MQPGILRGKAELLRLLGHPSRLALLDELTKGPKCVGTVQDLLDVPQANVSQHLGLLRRERIVDYHEDGKLRCYYIARPKLVKALQTFLGGDYPVVKKSPAAVREAAARRGRHAPEKPLGSRSTASKRKCSADREKHWDRVYMEKGDSDLSWYQKTPAVSLTILSRLRIPKDAAVLDVGGGGPSAFAGKLLDRGYSDVSVLDISAAALERCRRRLGNRCDRVKFLQSDVIRFKPARQYDLWHDRAVFHFLTDRDDRAAYIAALKRGLIPGGYAAIAAFAPDGPPRCSGLKVLRRSPLDLAEELGAEFQLMEALWEKHQTPWGDPQSFVYSLLRRGS